MKKFLALLLAAMMALSCAAFAAAEEVDADLLAAAKAEGELIVYGSAEEAYVSAACKHFEELYGIKVSYQRLSTGEVQAKITEENGNPSADVWFGGTSDPYAEAASAGLLLPYEAKNASHLVNQNYRDKDGAWYGIYKGILGFMVNTEELARMNLEVPQDWDDLLKPEYKGLIWLSNPATAGTAKLVINTMVQMTEIAEKEAAAEMLLEAKGFENAVVNLTGETADVVVPEADLEDSRRAQIEDIVKRKTGIAPENIVITPLNESEDTTVSEDTSVAEDTADDGTAAEDQAEETATYDDQETSGEEIVTEGIYD